MVPQYPVAPSSADEAGNAIEQLSALKRLARAEMLPLVRSLASQPDVLASDGCRGVASWLSMRLGMSSSSARDLSRVADATSSLPHLLAAFVSGSLSWDKLVLVCLFATPETDEQFAQQCSAMTMRQLRELSRRAQEISDDEIKGVHEARYLRFRPIGDSRMMRVEGLLPIEDGIICRDAVERVGNASGQQPDGSWLPADKLNADALVEICSGYLSENAPHDSAVIIEADISVLGGTGTADIGRDGVLSPEQLRRILCNASVELSVTKDAKTIGSGRRTRLFPKKVMRALMARDQGCRFPGCDRRRWVEGHHVQHWSHGGESNEDNGLILCWAHHGFVHEFGWKIEGNVHGALAFVRPDGHRFTGVAPLATEEIKTAFAMVLGAELARAG